MPGYDVYVCKDLDGRHWSFARQQKGMSCGPTAVKICKELYHNQRIGEEVIRGLVGMQHSGESNTGVTLLEAARSSESRWTGNGTMENMVLPAVQRQPLAIPGARFVRGLDRLKSASRNHPAILGFNWSGGGGHFVVCVGPTPRDPSKFVILDPDGGLQYVTGDESSGNAFFYKPSYGGKGQIDPIGYIVT